MSNNYHPLTNNTNPNTYNPLTNTNPINNNLSNGFYEISMFYLKDKRLVIALLEFYKVLRKEIPSDLFIDLGLRGLTTILRETVERISKGEYDYKGLKDSRDIIKGISDRGSVLEGNSRDILEGVNNREYYKGVSDSGCELEGVSNKSNEQRGVNNKSNEQRGVNNSSNNYKSVSDKDSKQRGVPLIISTNEQHPLINTTYKQRFLNNTTNEQHPLIISTNEQHPLNNTTYKQRPLINTTYKQHPLIISTNEQHPLNTINNTNNTNTTNNTTYITSSLVISIVNFFVPLLRNIYIPLLINNIRYFFNKEITVPSYKNMLINSLKRRNGVILLGNTLTGKSKLIRDCSVSNVYYYNPITLSNIFGCYKEGEWEDSNFIRDLRGVLGGGREGGSDRSVVKGDSDSVIGGVCNRDNVLEGVSNRDNVLEGVSDRGNVLEGVSDRRDILEGVSDRGSVLEGVSNRDNVLEGVSNRDNLLEGVSDRGSNIKGVIDKGTNIKGVNNSSNIKGVSDSMDTYHPVSNTPNQTWFVFDGPVTSEWIENFNSVLDDSKVLCLSSGESIRITSNCKFIFECDSISDITPATLTRVQVIRMEGGSNKGDSDMDSVVEGVSDGDNKYEGVSDRDSQVEGVSNKDSSYKGVNLSTSNREGVSNKDSSYKGVNLSTGNQEGVNTSNSNQQGVNDKDSDYDPITLNTGNQRGVNDKESDYDPITLNTGKQQGVNSLSNPNPTDNNLISNTLSNTISNTLSNSMNNPLISNSMSYSFNPNTTQHTPITNTLYSSPYCVNTLQFNYYFNTLNSLINNTPVIIVKGPLSTGKSTLVKSIITPFNHKYYNLRNNTDIDFYKEYRIIKGVKVYKPVNRLIICIDEFNTPVISNKVQESVREYLEYRSIGGVIIENVVIICIYNTSEGGYSKMEGVGYRDMLEDVSRDVVEGNSYRDVIVGVSYRDMLEGVSRDVVEGVSYRDMLEGVSYRDMLEGVSRDVVEGVSNTSSNIKGVSDKCISIEGVSYSSSNIKGVSIKGTDIEGLNISTNKHPLNISTNEHPLTNSTNGVIDRLTSKTPSLIFHHQIDFKYITGVIIERRLNKNISKEIRGFIYNIISLKGNLLTLNRFTDNLSIESDINREIELLFKGCSIRDKGMLEGGVSNKGMLEGGVSDSSMLEGVNYKGSMLEGVSNSRDILEGVNKDMLEGSNNDILEGSREGVNYKNSIYEDMKGVSTKDILEGVKRKDGYEGVSDKDGLEGVNIST
ncbi:hypothetical protein CWI37_1592p0010, partial [Hamiltosporidium tvaerminnensis]